MLRQEVNLYRSFALKRPAAEFLGWKRFNYIQLIFLSFLIIIYLISLFHVKHLQTKKIALQTQLQNIQKEFFNLKRNYPQLFFSQDVGQNVKILEKDIETQRKILSSLITPISFSHSLIGFATNIVPNVWLTGINISRSGNTIVIKGKSASMDLLQKFFSNLANDKLFSAFILNIDDISRPDKKDVKADLDFQLNMKYKTS